MNKKMNPTGLRSRRARGAVALVAAAAITFGAPAAVSSAATVIGVVDSQAISEIDTDRRVNLTLIKTPVNPNDDRDTPAPIIEGVTFTVKRVAGVDLGTEAGWALARSLSPAEAAARGFTHEFSARTDAEGRAYFHDLPVGLYLVSETPVRIPGHEPEEIVDFLITLPTGNVDGSSWDYDVLVNAKSEGVTTRPPIIPPIPVPSFPPPPTATQTLQPPPSEAPPGAPGENTEPPAGSGTQAGDSALANTGADVVWLVGIALLLIGGGALLIRSRRSAE